MALRAELRDGDTVCFGHISFAAQAALPIVSALRAVS
jgi:hypothetical protein